MLCFQVVNEYCVEMRIDVGIKDVSTFRIILEFHFVLVYSTIIQDVSYPENSVLPSSSTYATFANVFRVTTASKKD